MPAKESLPMSICTLRPSPAPRGDPLPILPRHLWSHLTPDQQQHLLQTLVCVCQELVAQASLPPGRKASDD
jgi:hypothetical protein